MPFRAPEPKVALLLGRYYMHAGMQTARWLLHGLAVRMSIALKLSEESRHDSQAPRDTSARARSVDVRTETRLRLDWSVFVADSFINGELRPAVVFLDTLKSGFVI